MEEELGLDREDGGGGGGGGRRGRMLERMEIMERTERIEDGGCDLAWQRQTVRWLHFYEVRAVNILDT